MADTKKVENLSSTIKGKTDKKNGEEKEADLSEEDRNLHNHLSNCVEILKDNNQNQYLNALKDLEDSIKSSTTSMTSVPKPLKFLRPHYDTIKQSYDKIIDPEIKKFCADIVSVLAMTMSEHRECLKFRLLGRQKEIGEWGHEYVRHIAGEVALEWAERSEDENVRVPIEVQNQLVELAKEIVPHNMCHNAENEACDLLMEIEHLDLIKAYVDENSYQRVCLYLTSCVPYVPDPENVTLLRTALDIFNQFHQYPQALRLALQLNDAETIKSIFYSCEDRQVKRQLTFMLGRQQVFLNLDNETDDDLSEIMSNEKLNHHFLNLGRELDILEPKLPEEVYKTHLDNARPAFGGGQVDSARQNLASSFVNGLVNAAFGKDKLLIDEGPNKNSWLYKNKEHGMLSAAASLGLILLWDVDGGLSQIDKFLYSNNDYIKSGALLACGIVNCGVRNECDPALALLQDYVLHESNVLKIGSIVGLGLAYAGSNRDDVIQLLKKVFHPKDKEHEPTMEIMGLTALSLGMVSVGSCNVEVTTEILQVLIERRESELKDTYAKFLPLGLGLCCLGKQTAVEVVTASLQVLPEPFNSMAVTLVEVCGYAGTGNVLKIQGLLHICSQHYETPEKEEKDSKKSKDDKDKEKEKKSDLPVDLSSQQAVAVIGIALIAMGEDIGADMAFRTFGHLLRYCEPVIRRAVPLALGLLSVSNPKLNILDTLSKFSHDSDPEVAHNSIFAMGLVSAGTNNARLASMLRQLAQYHAKDANNLFLVRIAQGLTHLGKGTLTLCPYHSDRQLMSPVAVAGLVATLVAFLDVKNIILGRSHYLLYMLAAAIQPRMLVTFDEELNALPISVRVGQAVDVVGQAGKPKTITGFQTYTTPVLLAYGERAELATEEYLPLSPIMEGFVILRKNPEYVA